MSATQPDLSRITSVSVPAAMRRRRQWVLWKAITRNGKPTKVPFSVTGEPASSTNPATWTDFDTASESLRVATGYAGIGFVFSADDQFVGIDMDGCRDPKTGTVANWARDWITSFGTYAEVSPSGTGVKLIALGRSPFDCGRRTSVDAPAIGAKNPGVEIYDHARFFTITGWRVESAPTTITEATGVLTDFATTFWPNETGKSTDSRCQLPDRAALVERCWHYIEKCPDAISGSDGSGKTLRAACECFRFGLTDGEAAEVMRRFNATKTGDEQWSDRELKHKLQAARQKVTEAGKFGCRLREDHQGTAHHKAADPTDSHPEGAARAEAGTARQWLPLTDTGLAERFARQHGDHVRYCHLWGKWFSWDSRRWCPDDMGAVDQSAKQTARSILREAAAEPDDGQRKLLVEFARKAESAQRRGAMLQLARSEPPIPIRPEALDQDDWLLNCKNGTIDLRTGHLREHRQADGITKLCQVEYTPDATAPTWLDFLRRIFDCNEGLIGFMQRLLGYCLTGNTSEQVLPIFHGGGANGKSTLVNVVFGMLGDDYSMKAPPDMLLARKHDAHPTERADLFGRRFVAAVETDDGKRLAESLVKELTGGDWVRARRMREDFWQFRPTHKVILACNHKPEVRGTDHAIWRRLRLVPFNVVIPDASQDKHLGDKLRSELPGILAWCVRGCLDWQAQGLGVPPEVATATASYRADEDTIGGFIEAHCVTGAGCKVRARALYEAYKAYCETSGEVLLSQKRFGRQMGERFRKDSSNGTWYFGIGLIHRDADPLEPSEPLFPINS